jgi:hypothetical protein
LELHDEAPEIIACPTFIQAVPLVLVAKASHRVGDLGSVNIGVHPAISRVASRRRGRYWDLKTQPPLWSPRSGPAAELLDDFLIALLDLPNWSYTALALWTDVALALPDKLFDRLDQYLEARCREPHRADHSRSRLDQGPPRGNVGGRHPGSPRCGRGGPQRRKMRR